jgi:predicted nucleotidyltransferase
VSSAPSPGGETDEESDIDFLVELEPVRTLLDLDGIQFDLEELLGRPVGVATPKSLKPRIRERGSHAELFRR